METKNATISSWTELQDFWRRPEVKMFNLEGFVVLVAMMLGSALILRTLRQRTALPFVPFVLRAVYYLSAHALSYVMGLLNDSPVRNGLVVLWAVFLIIFYESAESTGSEGLEDNEARRKRFLWDYLLPSLWFLALIIMTVPAQRFWIPILFLWILLIFKLREKKLALFSACRSPGDLDRIAKVISDFMRYQQDNQGDANPVTMHGYNYLVGVKEAVEKVNPVNSPHHERQLNLNDIATIDKIWLHCNGSVLGSSDEDNNLKDTCLSFALFWLLLRRFADYNLSELEQGESGRRKAWSLVNEGLVNHEHKKDVERAFRVIEVELDFLYDYFFNSYYAAYSTGGVAFLVVRSVLVALYVVVSFVILREYDAAERKSRPWYDVSNAQIYVTRSVIMVLTVVEVVQILTVMTSKWVKVKWICKYVLSKSNKTRLGVLERWSGYWLCKLPCIRRPWFKPWRRNLRQYSLLDSFGHTPMMAYLKCMQGHMDLPMAGQKEGDSINLSMDVKMAVIKSLKRTNGSQGLSDGEESLTRNRVRGSIVWHRPTEIDTNSHNILVWHIATSMCEMDKSTTSGLSDEANKNFEVASSLSRYCAYLVAFAPHLLPDHAYETRCCFEQAVYESRRALSRCNSKQEVYAELMNPSQEGNRGTIVVKGALLGKSLIDNISNVHLRWQVLAEFWAEKMVFLAPSDDAAGHAKYLVTGGEFITHLWVLLTHAGIVER